jgi:hypothetical protein
MTTIDLTSPTASLPSDTTQTEEDEQEEEEEPLLLLGSFQCQVRRGHQAKSQCTLQCNIERRYQRYVADRVPFAHSFFSI